MFNANYHSLQVQVQKKLSANSLVNVVYTWSKSLTDNQTDRSSAPQDSYCPHRCEYGLGAADRPHILTGNFVYEFPFLKEQRGVIGHLLGGWETSGILTFESGTPLTIFTSANQDPTGQGCLGPSPCSVRPDEIRDPNNAAPRSLSQWWDSTAYQDVPTGLFRNGTSRRGGVRGPGYWRTDFALFKNTKISERFTTQFRLESLNTFNHTNPSCCALTSQTSLGSTTFAKILGTRDPRIVQLGMKLNF
jgi:hypothetical protein